MVDGRLLAAGGAVALLVGVALVNSHRAAVDRAAHPPHSAQQIAPAPPPTAVAAGVCQPVSTQSAWLEASLPYAAAGHPDLRVSSSRCWDASGTRYPSLVHVVDLDDDHRIVATLIRPVEQLNVASLSVSGSTISVTAYLPGRPTADQVPGIFPAGSPVRSRLGGSHASVRGGSLLRIRFSSADGVHFSRGPAELIAGPCRSVQLQLGAVPVATGRTRPNVAVLLLHNTSRSPCALEGYPQVSGGTATGDLLTARPELSGPAGGAPDSGVPPVVLLADWASAVVEPADPAAPCTDLLELLVALPDGEALGGVSVRLRACDLSVHPLVPGTSGTLATSG